jgi:putative tryptophan/tyrosine transport system substrate-binding protein
MRRREFIAVAAGMATGMHGTAQAQSGRTRRVAWLGLGRPEQSSPYLESLRAGLREWGWVEGDNLVIRAFWATGREDMEGVARDLLATNPEVIVTQEFMVFPVKALTSTVPIVIGFSGDPVPVKLLESHRRPGGNVTGMSYLALLLVGKRIELLKEVVPEAQRLGILARPQHPGEPLERQASEDVVRKLGMELAYFPYVSPSFLPARDIAPLEKTFEAIRQARCDALVVFPDSAMFEVSDRVAQFAIQEKLPSVSGWAPFAHNGLLMTYGPNVRGLYRSLGRYVDRILRGDSPADLPFDVPTTFELVVNLKTAKSLRLTIPPPFLIRADEVIE